MKATKYVVFKIEMRTDGNKVEVGIDDVTDQVDVIPHQTMYYPQVDGITPSVIVEDEPQTCKKEKCAWWSIGQKYCELMLRDMPCEYKPRYEDEPQTEDEKVRDVVRGFIDLVNSMRNPTEEEMESVNKHIESISKPTGVNIFDEMDEPQTDCPWKQPDGRD